MNIVLHQVNVQAGCEGTRVCHFGSLIINLFDTAGAHSYVKPSVNVLEEIPAKENGCHSVLNWHHVQKKMPLP